MRKIKRDGSFFICLAINLILNFEWTIPAWILLGLHFWIDLSIWWFWGVIALWVLIMLFWMGVMRWVNSCSTSADFPKENKNPYSHKNIDN